jgi:signal transduction histidine kinase
LRVLLIIPLLALLFSYGSAADSRIIDITKPGLQPISKALDYIVDNDRAISAQELTGQLISADRFEIYQDQNLADLGENIWFRFEIENPSNESVLFVLDIHEVLIWFLDLAYLQGDKLQHFQIGLGTDNSERQLKRLFYSFPVTAEAGTQQFIYFRVSTHNSLIFSPYVAGPISYGDFTGYDDAISYLMVGILLGILIYMLSIMIGSGEYRDSFHYCLFVLFSLLLLLHCNGMLLAIWPTQSFWNTRLHTLIVAALGCSFLLFSRNYFTTRELSPKVDAVLVLLIYPNLAVMLIAMIFMPAWLVALAGYYTGFLVVFLIFFCLYFLKFHERPVWLFISGNLFFLALALFSIVETYGFGNLQGLSRHSYELGMVIQCLFFAIAASEKLQRFREESSRLHIEAAIAKQKDSAKSDFLARMSHEIRTPMNAILGFIDLLGGSKLDKQQRQYVETVNNAGHMLLGILNDVLDYSKLNAKMVTLERLPFNVTVLMQNTISLFNIEADKKGLSLELAINNNIPKHLMGDPTRLQQTIGNLVSNAIKFTETGTIVVALDPIEKTSNNGFIRFSVTDTGMGLSDKSKEELFNSFTQADTSITRKYGGTGLGLSICKQLVDLMGGKINITSQLGQGATFWFEIPLIKADPSKVVLTEDLPVLEMDFAGLAILVVEDNEINQYVLRAMLTKLNASCAVVNDGQQAIDEITTGHNYDLILMDCEMPVMDGFTATQKILQWEHDSQRKHTPIIALTAHAIDEYKQRCFDCGMDGHISKPIKIEVLRSSMSDMLRDKS